MNTPKLFAHLFLSLCACLALSAADPEKSETKASLIPAFPGAEGFGFVTPGGRGGKVHLVTNLDDSGKGSLRAACEAQGPRIVVFRVAGTIALRSSIVVRNPFLTIAGQSAPGGGICIKDHPLQVATHDVVIRYLRSRLGDESGAQDDCIDFLNGAANSIIDHCSATWSIDECLSLSGDVSHVTVQWCLIGQALKKSIHKKGAHGFGSLARANGPVSFHHNLWIHNDSRNPRMGGNYSKPPAPFFDVRNNVIYNYGDTCTGLTQGFFNVNYVNNYIRSGPNSTARVPINIGDNSDLKFYISGNSFEGNEALSSDNTKFFSRTEAKGKRIVEVVDTPFKAVPVRTYPVEEALEMVLASVGASLPARDSVDQGLIDDVRSKKGRHINSQKEVGGWPELALGKAPVDSDKDGMPDDWEAAHGLDSKSASDAALDSDQDGYTNIEECLNNTDPRTFIDYRKLQNNQSSL